MNLEKKLTTRWHSLCQRIGAIGNTELIFQKLVESYSEDHRHYHNLVHIDHCLNEFDEVSELIKFPNETEKAIFQHDRVYDTHKFDNELVSAKLAYQDCKTMGLNDTFSQRVCDGVLITEPGKVPKNNDEKYFADIDLAILGRPEEEFDTYERNIQKEYFWVPTPLRNAFRTQILKGILQKSTIYQTDHFQGKYEDQAQINLERSIENLKGILIL